MQRSCWKSINACACVSPSALPRLRRMRFAASLSSACAIRSSKHSVRVIPSRPFFGTTPRRAATARLGDHARRTELMETGELPRAGEAQLLSAQLFARQFDVVAAPLRRRREAHDKAPRVAVVVPHDARLHFGAVLVHFPRRPRHADEQAEVLARVVDVTVTSTGGPAGSRAASRRCRSACSLRSFLLIAGQALPAALVHTPRCPSQIGKSRGAAPLARSWMLASCFTYRSSSYSLVSRHCSVAVGLQSELSTGRGASPRARLLASWATRKRRKGPRCRRAMQPSPPASLQPAAPAGRAWEPCGVESWRSAVKASFALGPAAP